MLRYIEEEMSIGKLKGHSYNFNKWQYAEAFTHIDPELQYIVQTSASSVPRDTQDRIRVSDATDWLADTITTLICERENISHKTIDRRSIRLLLWDSYKRHSNTQSMDLPTIINEFMIYAIVYALHEIRRIKFYDY